MLTDHVCIRDGQILYVDVTVDAVLNRIYRKFEDELRIKITRRIQNFFNLQRWDYNQNLKDSDMLKVLSDIREVNRYDLSFITNDPNNSGLNVSTKYYEIIRPDNIDINFTYE
jgi:hypothetical protein